MLPSLTEGELTVRPWPDPVIDQLGHDVRGRYVEHFWLSVLGPSATLLLRRLGEGLQTCPDGFVIDLATTAVALGLKPGASPHAPFGRSVMRLCRFQAALVRSPTELAVRRHLPPLNRRQLERLPPDLADEHDHFVTTATLTAARARVQRARQLALSVVGMGEPAEVAVRHLRHWRIPEDLATAAVAWACENAGSEPNTAA